MVRDSEQLRGEKEWGRIRTAKYENVMYEQGLLLSTRVHERGNLGSANGTRDHGLENPGLLIGGEKHTFAGHVVHKKRVLT